MSSAPSRRSLVLGGTAAALGAPLLSASTASAATPGHGSGRVTPGADVAAAEGWKVLRGRKVGVVSNPTGVLRNTSHVVDSMAATKELNVVGVFGPEHGFRGSAQAGESEPEFEDPRTGLTVYDAYGADAAKMATLFRKAGADTIVFDIQDVGVRFYTYIWTMYHAMAAARDIGASFVVLDRPNPCGRRVDGPLMTKEFTSGVGLKPIIQQHGLTVGELAGYFNGELLPGEGKGGKVELEVVRARGLDPSSTGQETGLPWVPPSPNMPFPDTATAYAGTGYFEGTNLSEGRGTTRPFELIGAPYLDYRYSDRLNARDLPGVRFREGYFVPTFSKHQGETCAGVQLHITDPRRYRAVPTAVAMLAEAMKYDEFAWRKDDDPRPYWIDKLSGSTRLRKMLDAGEETDAVVAAWESEVRDFDRTRRQYFLYR
ncbi:exo-beta-N-acetylmuramidase NamZ domain-containing protein [Streptomyces ovatisporus]|uniref:Exo-beta-N-acetylmuramidase NamZ domain-containing protein n=1 Tax=Streptomyces ovatisporus TaxID=1128682 RepID=A0ABV9A8T4_9ACTN